MKASRPTTLDENGKLAVAMEIAQEICEAGCYDMEDMHPLANAIAKHGRLGTDGFELGMAIMQYEGFEVSFEVSEYLDGFPNGYRKLLKVIQENWRDDHNIEPPYEDGTMVRFTWGGESMEGVIKEVNKFWPCQYIIDVEGRSGSPVVNFEDVKKA